MTTEDYNEAPEHVAVLDPQVGWEQQKFLIAYTLLHLPSNEKQHWLDMIRLWEMGRENRATSDNPFINVGLNITQFLEEGPHNIF